MPKPLQPYYDSIARKAEQVRQAAPFRAFDAALTGRILRGAQNIGSAVGSGASFAWESAKLYPGMLGTEISTAGTTIVETGRSAGDFVGDHVSKLWYDPAAEFHRVKTAAVQTAVGIRNTAVDVYHDPLGAASGVVNATIDYADRLTKDPTVSGQLLGNGTVAWATGGATAAGKQALGSGLAALSNNVFRSVADTLQSKLGRAPSTYPTGTFSITNSGWRGYPEGLPKPQGPFRLLEGMEYDNARAAANATNNAVRLQHDLGGLDIHEIQPVKFNGSPTDFSNKMLLEQPYHRQVVTPWWNALQRQIEGPK